MGQPRITERVLTLDATGGANDTLRCWDAAEGEAFENMSILVTSRGEVLAAGNLDWDIFYGGYFTGGEPYVIGSTHVGGTSQGNGVIAGGAAVNSTVHTDAGPFLSNRVIQHPSGDGALAKGMSGLAIVCELTNDKAVPITVRVVFSSETVVDWR